MSDNFDFYFSCEQCRKGFLHQNQLYAHHKQRHANEDPQYSLFDQPEQRQEYTDNDPIDFIFETQ
jgi:hypothetical protein